MNYIFLSHIQSSEVFYFSICFSTRLTLITCFFGLNISFHLTATCKNYLSVLNLSFCPFFLLNFFFNKLEELLSEGNIRCDKVGQGDRIEGKKDKDIIALTDRSHIKAPLFCLLATLGWKKGTKGKEKGKRRGNMISQHIFYYFSGGRVWLFYVLVVSPYSTPVL